MNIVSKEKLNSKGKCYGTCPYRVIIEKAVKADE